MLAQRAWLSGLLSGCAAGLCVGVLLACFCVCLAMRGKDPLLVSLQGRVGQVRAVEIDGTVYRLVSASRYDELSRYEWTVRHGH